MAEPIIRIIENDSEADTCRKFVLPKLKDESSWTDEQILEQRPFTAGKIIVIGRIGRRKKAKKADYLLRYSQNFLIAVVEAKRHYKTAAEGMQQAKDYARILGIKFAYATNGTEIHEFDFITGLETKIQKFPNAQELWNRLNVVERVKPEIQETFLKPFVTTPGKEIRYYQQIAINRAVKAILEGKRRALLTLATGTGKTTIAFQIIHKLWSNRWNTKGEHRRPKVLFLADRSVLVTDPHAKDFALFGDARCLVPEEGLPSSREIYFSTYQSLAEDNSKVGAFRNVPRNFFDLIVIDECHRGSSSNDSNWRTILSYFNTSVQLGLTATPLRDDNKDTYAYFGNPLYTYSLGQGIEDGFLAPYIVHRIVTEIDATGFRPHEGQRDANGELIPDGVYTTPDFENTLSILPRTKAVAKHLCNFMLKNGRFDKTIVFCVDQEHADHFRREISNLNADLARQYPEYAVRIVSEEGDVGKGYLGRFMDIDEPIPVVVTTSRLMTTGVDVPTCKNIVLFRMVNSVTEFKQIIGRGTRVRDDKQKLFFTILDYTGSATRNFADPEFDGEPPLITEEEIDDEGNSEGQITIAGSDQGDFSDWEPTTDDEDYDDGYPPDSPLRRRKFYVVEGEIGIAAESIQIIDPLTGRLVTVQLAQYVREKVSIMFPSANDFKSHWDNLEERKQIVEQLEDFGISVEQLMEVTNQKELDPFDLLCFVAYNLKPKTRKQRADLLKKNKPDFFINYSEKAQHVLQMILEKYVEYGLNQIRPDIISVDPFTKEGNTMEIIASFGGMTNYKKAIEGLQTLLYTEAA
ncbi:EcoAI/FtnUII family type I restriction enzme subunit R [Segetibacter aerophilus]|uniref:DEAD/DEAH box helicase n=1 Tax=Segetibacter aerophilus TaxID=670293 RepID=A0A512B8K8_9BACT|nr:DEAD/DEAH box helicase family protein [Segetibacter aerophilus]GEO08296.1 DEAD/DEAH box helicase [Segetibacter aerophilus]